MNRYELFLETFLSILFTNKQSFRILAMLLLYNFVDKSGLKVE